MADKGLSISFLASSKKTPVLLPSLANLLENEGVMLSKTASQIEHKKEKIIESKKNVTSNAICKYKELYVCNVQITSTQNAKIKQLIKLQQKSRERKATKSFVVEGLQENRLALTNEFKPKQFFVQEDLYDDSLALPKVEIYQVTREVFDKIAYQLFFYVLP